MENVLNDILNVLIKNEIITIESLRNYIIRETHQKLIDKGIKNKEARELLGNKYLLSDSGIQKIIYKKISVSKVGPDYLDFSI